MTDPSTIHDDITYMRKLAESGRKGPILGGVFLAGAGIVFAATCYIDAAMQNGLLPFRIEEGPLWIGASLVFVAFWFVMFFRMMRLGKPASTAQNAAFGVVWSVCGAGVMVSFLTTMLLANTLHTDVVKAAYVPVIYAFYGTAWCASAAFARRKWMFVAGIGSYLYAFVVAMMLETPWGTLVMGSGLLLLLTLPGLKLIADEKHS